MLTYQISPGIVYSVAFEWVESPSFVVFDAVAVSSNGVETKLNASAQLQIPLSIPTVLQLIHSKVIITNFKSIMNKTFTPQQGEESQPHQTRHGDWGPQA